MSPAIHFAVGIDGKMNYQVEGMEGITCYEAAKNFAAIGKVTATKKTGDEKEEKQFVEQGH